MYTFSRTRPHPILSLLLLLPALLAPRTAQAAEPPARHWSDWTSVTVAAAQITQQPDRDNVAVFLEYVDRAGREGAELIVGPEYMLGPFSPDGATPAVQRVAAAARRNGIYVILGGWEELEPGAANQHRPGKFANTVLLFDRAGRIAGKYRKNHGAYGGPPHFWPAQKEDAEAVMKLGDGYPVFDLDFGRLGIMTCYDGYFAESAAALSLQGAEIVAWVNARGGSVEDYMVKSDMNRHFIAMIATNQGGGQGTMIGQWPSQILAQVPGPGDHYLLAPIDLARLREARAHARMLHQRRPEIYTPLSTPQQPWAIYKGTAYAPVTTETGKAWHDPMKSLETPPAH